MALPFQDRQQAGTLLAEKLITYRNKKDTVILALVRGGVGVGRAMADALHLPLYPYIVRKIGHPGHREYALGAIAQGGGTFLDETAMQLSGVAWEDLEPIIEEEMQEMQRRKSLFQKSQIPDLPGKTVILTDDGAATGASLFAALRDLRSQAEELVVALPVCPPDTAQALRKKAHKLVTLATPEPFDAVGKWYRDFPQLEDDEVLALLSRPALSA